MQRITKRKIRKVGKRIKELEKKWERMEREDKKQNIIIKGIEKGEGELKESVRNIIKELGVEAEIKNVRKTGGRKEGREEMAVVTLGSWEQKRKVMEKKRLLKGRKERIDDDLTWEKRRIRQKLIEIAIKEERTHVARTGHFDVRF